MPFLPADERYLDRALELAAEAAAFASPNPTVGCVLVRDEQVLGEGAHRYAARDHAEIVALKSAAVNGHRVRGATAYVTLEPCSHHGRTGPCADALIAAGIVRCVVATVDPNPLVREAGLRKLRAAGLEVNLAEVRVPSALRARRLNDAFAFSVQHGRPFVTLKAAVSLDDKLAPAPGKRLAREPFWLTGTAARAEVHRLRYASDALLTGIGTVLADDPSLTDRTGLPRRRPLLRVVLDTHLRTPLDSRLVRSAERDLLLVCGEEALQAREQALRARGVDVLRLPSPAGRLDLNLVMGALAAVPVCSLLVEGGVALNGALLQQNLVDKLVVFRAPVELGSEALPFAHGIALERLERGLVHAERTSFPNGSAADIRLSGYLHDPWAGV